MKMNMRLGGILAIIGALIGIVGHYVLFINWYRIGMSAESAEPGCEILLKYIHPALADLGILAGVLFAVSAYGFFTKARWSFLLSIIALTLALLGSWFINVPYMAAGLPPIYFTLFWPYLILYFLFTSLRGWIGHFGGGLSITQVTAQEPPTGETDHESDWDVDHEDDWPVLGVRYQAQSARQQSQRRTVEHADDAARHPGVVGTRGLLQNRPSENFFRRHRPFRPG